MIQTGILLINLGTPDHPDISSVRKYLKDFLSDKRVIDLPIVLRYLLLYCLILPFRTKTSTAAYQKIWTDQGSPLLINSLALQNALAQKLGPHYQVELGMRYGNPSISSALKKLHHCQNIHILPLFPQYSSAATGSAIEATLKIFSKQWNIPNISLTHSFYNHPKFIASYAQLIQHSLNTEKPDIILFSYHGLPERHIKKSECTAACDLQHPCPGITEKNYYCYRAQCYETSRLIAQKLQLSENQYCVTFQSRLGKTPWIKPYTDQVLIALSQKNIKNILIACPSFVADCLETLEEIGIRAQAQWESLRGEKLTLVPCLNANDEWVEAVVEMIECPSSSYSTN